MGIISLNEKRTALNFAHTTGKEKSFFTSDQFREPPAAEVITTNLDIHYDFGDTNCWSGEKGTATSNWRIYDLQGNHDAAIKRHTTSGWRHRSDSPLISKQTTNGGCIQFDPYEWVNDYSRTAILVQTIITASSTTNWYVAANTDSVDNFIAIPQPNDSPYKIILFDVTLFSNKNSIAAIASLYNPFSEGFPGLFAYPLYSRKNKP